MTNSATAASPGTVAGASRSDVVSRLAIGVTIILAVPDTAHLASFYERAYSEDPAASEAHARWRALGAVGKADHVIALCARAGIHPASTLEVGCGDGARLSVACELEDPLPRNVHVFFAAGAPARASGTAKWALRAGLHRASPRLARRLFTVHYACLCVPAG